MALFNNTAQICFELSEFRDLRVFLDRLIEVVISRPTYADATLSAAIGLAKRQFLLNALELNCPSIAGAA